MMQLQKNKIASRLPRLTLIDKAVARNDTEFSLCLCEERKRRSNLIHCMKEEKECGIYILSNKGDTVLYTGVTGKGIKPRVWEHKNDLVEGFTKKYKCHKLVYYEYYDDMEQAIAREKQIKGGSRADKIKFIESKNPTWKDLYDDLDQRLLRDCPGLLSRFKAIARNDK